MTRPLLITLAVALVVGYAALSTVWVGHEPGWYAGLAKPSFQPPDAVFGVIWPLNFLALGVVSVLVASSASPARAGGYLATVAASIAAALAWAYLFYVPHRLPLAAVALGVAAALTWLVVLLAWRALGGWALLLTPYALWMCTATALSIGYARLN